MNATEVIMARGHPLVRGTHPTTFEVTMEDTLTLNGNCIIAVGADKGAAQLSSQFKSVLSHEGATLLTRLECRGISVEIRSLGGPGLLLDHETDLVWRRSRFCCGRTIGICSDHVALTLPRELIRYLGEGESLRVILVAGSPE